VPEELRTLEVCRVAVEDDNRALEFVPGPLREQLKDIIPRTTAVEDYDNSSKDDIPF
jgi:hypothetical protein